MACRRSWGGTVIANSFINQLVATAKPVLSRAVIWVWVSSQVEQISWFGSMALACLSVLEINTLSWESHFDFLMGQFSGISCQGVHMSFSWLVSYLQRHNLCQILYKKHVLSIAAWLPMCQARGILTIQRYADAWFEALRLRVRISTKVSLSSFGKRRQPIMPSTWHESTSIGMLWDAGMNSIWEQHHGEDTCLSGSWPRKCTAHTMSVLQKLTCIKVNHQHWTWISRLHQSGSGPFRIYMASVTIARPTNGPKNEAK